MKRQWSTAEILVFSSAAVQLVAVALVCVALWMPHSWFVSQYPRLRNCTLKSEICGFAVFWGLVTLEVDSPQFTFSRIPISDLRNRPYTWDDAFTAVEPQIVADIAWGSGHCLKCSVCSCVTAFAGLATLFVSACLSSQFLCRLGGILCLAAAAILCLGVGTFYHKNTMMYTSFFEQLLRQVFGSHDTIHRVPITNTPGLSPHLCELAIVLFVCGGLVVLHAAQHIEKGPSSRAAAVAAAEYARYGGARDSWDTD
eukprot:gnl/MRDRNA2_/MRDRNA2_243141_c0_seq1.p1 gnl/MRDRNA2_/MRDRNA2_243141_c0~~gnl/MRDRNA2_/MRDRNA2_243141_c0_seq1.p1  ORF type:complete len:255 (+),score=30.20 gnl/MRDRNA2_/MRDRNA2_243141_c0_seq1:35-799(+)